METVIIIAVVGFAYLLLRGGGAGSAQVGADINANAQYASQLLPGMVRVGQQSTQVQVAGVESSLANTAAQATSGIPIVGPLLALGASLLGQHSARVQGATAENTGIDAIVPAVDADLREINAAYRQGQISATMAVTYLAQVRDQYWQYMGQFQGKPGVGMRPCPAGQVGGPIGKGGCTSGQPVCDKTCTAGCCVGCGEINGSIANCVWAVQAGYHGPVAVCTIYGSKFGAHDRLGYQLSW